MGFVIRKLKEDEIRKYVLKEKVIRYRFSNYVAEFPGGVIDDENDVRMFIYGNAMRPYESPFWDMKDSYTQYGILDYKGEVIFFTVYVTCENCIKIWRLKEFYTKNDIEEKKDFLKRALIAYKGEGYTPWFKFEEADPNYDCLNRSIKGTEVYFEISNN